VYLGAGRQRIGQAMAILAAPPVDEDHHVGTQMALVVEHVAAQLRIQRKCGLEPAAQRGRVGVELGHGDEPPQLRRERDMGHGAMMRRAKSVFK